MVKKLADLYLQTRKTLMENQTIETAGMVTRELLAKATGRSREEVLALLEEYVGDDVCQALARDVEKIQAGMPVAYVLGEWEFYGLPLYVDENVLIPRDDTCAVTELAIKQSIFLDTAPRILDLCTGSGCIGLAVASRVPDARVTLADVSKSALAVARRNIARNKLSSRVSCVQADALSQPPGFLGQFDLIVSNPPYITGREMGELEPSVRDYEPHLALYGGEDGLAFYRAIAAGYRSALKPGGLLCFEFGMGQGNAVCAILEANGYTVLERTKDYNHRERAVIARYERKEMDHGYEKDNL